MNTHNIHNVFYSLIQKFTSDEAIFAKLWKEILGHYNSPKRYYHNLSHIEELLFHFNDFNDDIKNKELLLFAIFYHDVIYDVLKKHNEEKSALFAVKRMNDLGVSKQDVDLCSSYIIATKNHILDIKDKDLAYFLDFDMAILAKHHADYLKYTRQVRKEYGVFPDFMYRKGRKKVLENFLKKERIFVSDIFYKRFEKQARENIQNELILLNE